MQSSTEISTSTEGNRYIKPGIFGDNYEIFLTETADSDDAAQLATDMGNILSNSSCDEKEESDTPVVNLKCPIGNQSSTSRRDSNSNYPAFLGNIYMPENYYDGQAYVVSDLRNYGQYADPSKWSTSNAIGNYPLRDLASRKMPIAITRSIAQRPRLCGGSDGSFGRMIEQAPISATPKVESEGFQFTSDIQDQYPITFVRDRPDRSPVNVHKLVLQAIYNIKNKEGCTPEEIKQYLHENTDISVRMLNGEIDQFLWQGSENGVLLQTNGRYAIAMPNDVLDFIDPKQTAEKQKGKKKRKRKRRTPTPNTPGKSGSSHSLFSIFTSYVAGTGEEIED